MKQPHSVCVYCGAREGRLAGAVEAATSLGAAIANRGWQLVYGGGRSGLMGAVADGALASGGRVIGYIPQALMELERGHAGLAELHVVNTMHERKMAMAQRSDAFIALPGGIGTFEELFETWTWHQLGYHTKPMGLLNVGGYYDGLLQFTAQAARLGYMTKEQLEILQVHNGIDQLLDGLGPIANTANTHGTDYRSL